MTELAQGSQPPQLLLGEEAADASGVEPVIRTSNPHMK
jgi:hypothetical protein